MADAKQKADRWQLEPASVARSKSGLPKSKAMAMVDPPTPQPSTPRFNGRPFVEIWVKNGCVNYNYSGSCLCTNATCSLRALCESVQMMTMLRRMIRLANLAKCIGKGLGEHATRALHRKESALYLTTT